MVEKRLKCRLSIHIRYTSLIVMMLFMGCRKKDNSVKAHQIESKEGPVTVHNYEGYQEFLALGPMEHLADVHHHGLWIDFGTPARMKYTAGNWKSGWSKDKNSDGATVSYVGKSARLFVPLENKTAHVMTLRIKPVGSSSLTVYLNHKPLSTLQLTNGLNEYQLNLPEDLVIAGENYLLLRFSGEVLRDGELVSAMVDWVRVTENASANVNAPPVLYGKMKSTVPIGNERRRALLTAAPTKLTWYFEVPVAAHDPQLGFGIGLFQGERAQAKVSITPEGGHAVQLQQSTLKKGEKWSDQRIDLKPYAGKVVRLDLQSEPVQGQNAQGALGVAWSEPRVLIRKPDENASKKYREGAPAKNLIVLLIDTLRADKLAPFNPSTRVKADAIAVLGKNGTVFQNAQSPENWTKPSVASVLTSLWPMTHRAKTDDAKLADKATLISEVLKSNGFQTGSFIANGYVSEKFGFNQGWDHYVNYIRDGKNTKAENVFSEAAKWIESHKDKRFFAYVHTIDPHVPYIPPESYLKMYDSKPYQGIVDPRLTADQLEKAKRNPPAINFSARDRERLEALYDAEISYHDDQLKQFVEKLKAWNLMDNTLFVVTADHGEEFYDHQSFGHGHSVYQELLHVPLMFHYPPRIGTARVDDTVSTVDLAPTALQVLGVEVPKVFEGTALNAYFGGGRLDRMNAAFSDFLDDRRVVRTGDWKLIMRGNQSTLFDLKTDPRELTELTVTSRPIAGRLCRILLGQFLGTTARAKWVQPAVGGNAQDLEEQKAAIDDKLRSQLKALGYGN